MKIFYRLFLCMVVAMTASMANAQELYHVSFDFGNYAKYFSVRADGETVNSPSLGIDVAAGTKISLLQNDDVDVQCLVNGMPISYESGALMPTFSFTVTGNTDVLVQKNGAMALSFTLMADPEHISSISIGNAKGMGKSVDSDEEPFVKTLNFSTEGTVNTLGVESETLYIRVVPKNNVKYSGWMYASSGNRVTAFMMINREADYTTNCNYYWLNNGRLEIESESIVAIPNEIYVNVTGSTDKLKMMMGEGNEVRLHGGANTVARTSSIVSFMASDGSAFYKVMHFDERFPEGIEVMPGDANEGGNDSGVVSETIAEKAPSYVYTFTGVKAGERFDIYTDFPEGPFAISVAANDGVAVDELITEVLVNGTPVADWADGFSVRGGQTVTLVGDKWNFIPTSSMINGEETEVPSVSLEYLVRDCDVNFTFDVTKIERSGQMAIYVPNDVNATLMSNLGTVKTLAHGHNVLAFGNEEFTIDFNSNVPTSSDEELPRYVFVNEQQVSVSGTLYTWTPQEGQVVKVYNSASAPSHCNVTFDVDRTISFTPVIVKDFVAFLSHLTGHDVLPGTVISIKPASGYSFSQVLANDVDVLPEADGSYNVTVNGPTNVKIKQIETGIEAIEAAVKEGKVYNFQGIEVKGDKLARGLYIIDGKKVVIK